MAVWTSYLRTASSWFELSQAAWWLTMDAASVIALRGARVALGGPLADRECQRMVAEKMKAALALQVLAMTGGLGFTPQAVAAKTLTHYSKAVRANRRRLTRVPR